MQRTETEVLSLFAATQEWLGPDETAEKLNFFPARSARTYLKRLWSFGLLERRSRGRGTMEYRFSELGKSRLGPNPEIDLALEAAKVALARFNCYGTVRKSKIPYREI